MKVRVPFPFDVKIDLTGPLHNLDVYLGAKINDFNSFLNTKVYPKIEDAMLGSSYHSLCDSYRNYTESLERNVEAKNKLIEALKGLSEEKSKYIDAVSQRADMWEASSNRWRDLYYALTESKNLPLSKKS